MDTFDQSLKTKRHKNQNLYPHETRITYSSFPWDTLYDTVRCVGFITNSSDKFTNLKFQIYNFFTSIYHNFFFNCSNWEKFVEEISETNWWKHLMNSLFALYKVHIFWEGHKIFRNLYPIFVICSASQK